MALYVVSSGQTSSGLDIGRGDLIDVMSGGTALDTTLRSSATETLSGGTGSDSLVSL
jgi:hypothetical protein